MRNKPPVLRQHHLGYLFIHLGHIVFVEEPPESRRHLIQLFLPVGRLPFQGFDQGVDFRRYANELNANAERLVQHPLPEAEVVPVCHDVAYLVQRLAVFAFPLLIRPGEKGFLLSPFHLLEIALVDGPVRADSVLIGIFRARVFAGILDTHLRVFQHFLEHHLLPQFADVDAYRVVNIATLSDFPRGIVVIGPSGEAHHHGIIPFIHSPHGDFEPPFRAQGHVPL